MNQKKKVERYFGNKVEIENGADEITIRHPVRSELDIVPFPDGRLFALFRLPMDPNDADCKVFETKVLSFGEAGPLNFVRQDLV